MPDSRSDALHCSYRNSVDLLIMVAPTSVDGVFPGLLFSLFRVSKQPLETPVCAADDNYDHG